MKGRNGFVTNSSSTSFCIVGKFIHEEDLYIDKIVEVFNKLDANNQVTKDDVIDDLYTIVETISTTIDVHGGDDCGGYWVGLDISKLQEDETLSAFKSRVQKELEKLGLSGNVEIVVETSENY